MFNILRYKRDTNQNYIETPFHPRQNSYDRGNLKIANAEKKIANASKDAWVKGIFIPMVGM
jgi:hypothetical protein